MGLLFGAGAGLLIMAVGTHRRNEHFDDFTYWIDDDGICYPKNINPSAPDMGVRVRTHIIKGRKAYLWF